MNKIKYSSLLIHQQGSSEFAQLSKMQKYANNKRLSPVQHKTTVLT